MRPSMTTSKLVRFCPLFLPLLLWLSGFQSALAQSQLTNLSTRVRLQTPFPSDLAAAGFTITGTGSSSKKVILRALGTTLANPPPMTPLFTFAEVLTDPFLTLFGCASCPLMNDDWYFPGTASMAYFSAFYALPPMLPAPPPPIHAESAIVELLPTGPYTATMESNNFPGTHLGFGLVEVYDLDPTVGRVVNLSTRAFVGTGDARVIAGFILMGVGEERIVLRGLGPSVGVPPSLADPTLELRDSDGSLLLSNNNWRDNPVQAAELQALLLAPPNDLEAGMVATLPSGAYTVLLAGNSNTTGIGLVEIYDVGPP